MITQEEFRSLKCEDWVLLTKKGFKTKRENWIEEMVNEYLGKTLQVKEIFLESNSFSTHSSSIWNFSKDDIVKVLSKEEVEEMKGKRKFANLKEGDKVLLSYKRTDSWVNDGRMDFLLGKVVEVSSVLENGYFMIEDGIGFLLQTSDIIKIVNQGESMQRMSKNEYYLNIAKAVSERSTCLRRHYGAIIVKNDRIISTGYNGSARGEPNCCDVGTCYREAHNIPHGEQYEKCVAVHAEQNAISSGNGQDIIGSTLYLYGKDKNGQEIEAEPCLMCKRAIINAKIKNVIASDGNGKYRLFL